MAKRCFIGNTTRGLCNVLPRLHRIILVNTKEIVCKSRAILRNRNDSFFQRRGKTFRFHVLFLKNLTSPRVPFPPWRGHVFRASKILMIYSCGNEQRLKSKTMYVCTYVCVHACADFGENEKRCRGFSEMNGMRWDCTKYIYIYVF